MSWSAIIIVNSVWDTCTSFATRLRFDLYTFWEIFGWVWLWSLCVQQFWACKFMVSLCLLLLVQWGEVRWGDEWRMIFLESSCGGVWIHQFNYLEDWDGDGVDVCSWMTAVLSSEVLAWLTAELLHFLCVSPYQRLLRSAILHTKELCRVYIWQCSVIDSSPSVVCCLYCVNWSFPSSHLILQLLCRA